MSVAFALMCLSMLHFFTNMTSQHVDQCFPKAKKETINHRYKAWNTQPNNIVVVILFLVFVAVAVVVFVLVVVVVVVVLVLALVLVCFLVLFLVLCLALGLVLVLDVVLIRL